ncbi:MAG: hypothetical protein PVI03_04415 [Candidatus Thorarchaeota archaeon]|jgi:drug/metabolite transporter (DMT)-like permease
MSYWTGVFLAITAGINNNLGSVLQKKVVNDLPPEEREKKFFRNLVRKRLWLAGLFLQYILGSALMLLAQVYIGPALVPGLHAIGLIVLAIGSIKLVGESLRKQEVLGITLLMLATALFSFSELEISIPAYDFLETSFLLRLGLFTGLLMAAMMALYLVMQVRHQLRSISLALISGILLAISGYWIAPMLATIVHVFDGSFIVVELGLFAISCITLVLSNIFAVGSIQDAFKTGNASLLIPIQSLPMLVVPGFVFLVVFFLAPPTAFSLMWFLAATIMTIISSFLLGRRQMMLEAE